MAVDVTKPHHPSPECEDRHCWWHDMDEDSPAAYRVCLECWHAFMTEAELQEAWRTEVAPALSPGFTVPSVDEIFACPYCAHDF